MTQPTLPRIGQTLTQDDRTTAPFYKWFEAVNRALTAGGLTFDQAGAAIAVIATKLGSPDGTVAGIPVQSRNTYKMFSGFAITVDGDGSAGSPWVPNLTATTDQVPEGTTNLYFPEAPIDGTPYARKDGAWEAVAGGSGVSDGDKGDVTVSGSGLVWTVDNDTITNAKLANVATLTIKGRVTGSTGDPEDLTALQAASIVQGDGLDADACGFRGVPQNSQSGNYTCVAADAGKEIYHPSGAGAGDTFTLPANGGVAYEIGTAITFRNMDSNALTIAITTDTMYLAGTGSTGSRTLAQYGVATACKLTSTTWMISGIGLT